MKTGRELLDEIDRWPLAASPLNAPYRSPLESAVRELSGAPIRPSPRSRYNLACHLRLSDPERCLQILRNDSRRVARPWALTDPVLEDLRVGIHGPEMRASLLRGTWESKPPPLSCLDAIGPTASEQLARVGIHTPADLLFAAGPVASRERLAKQLGCEAGEILPWAHLCELAIAIDTVPIPEKSPAVSYPLDVANLLALAGIASCAQLKARTEADVRTALRRANDVAHVMADVGLASVNAWIEAAKAFKTSVVEPPPTAGTVSPAKTATDPKESGPSPTSAALSPKAC